MFVSKLFGTLFSIKLSSKKQTRQTVLVRSIESVTFAVVYLLPAICLTDLLSVVALVSIKLTIAQMEVLYLPAPPYFLIINPSEIRGVGGGFPH